VDIFTSLGLALPAGLNAYIPLLVVGLTARYTDLITLEAPYDILSSDAGLMVLGVLLVIEIFADAIPGLDHINDIVHTVVRPAAGGIVMLATDGGMFSEVHPGLLFLLGLVAAGSVHTAKASTRPLITATTGGIGNPVVSAAENVVAVVISVLAILVPFVLLGIVMLLAVLVARGLFRLRRERGYAARQQS
jgi:hypothetical protein